MKHGLSETTITSIIATLKNYDGVEKVTLFGSRAKGNYRNGSDIDLMIVGSRLTTRDIEKLLIQIDDLDLPYTIDLVLESHVDNQNLLNHVSRVGIVLYETTKSNVSPGSS